MIRSRRGTTGEVSSGGGRSTGRFGLPTHRRTHGVRGTGGWGGGWETYREIR